MDLAQREIGLAENPLQNLPDSGGVVDDENIQRRGSCHYIPLADYRRIVALGLGRAEEMPEKNQASKSAFKNPGELSIRITEQLLWTIHQR
jgi:hypothetical protein